MGEHNLKINKIAGIFGICAGIALFISTMLSVTMIGLPFTQLEWNQQTNLIFLISTLISFSTGIPAIVLFSIALSKSKTASLPIKGHVIGIVGTASYFFIPFLVDFISMILMVIGAILILKLRANDDLQGKEL